MPERPSKDYKKTVEAALFVSGNAMDADQIAKTIGIASVGHVKRMLDELVREYEARDSALVIARIGDRYTLGIRPEYAENVSSLAGAPDISKGTLRTLAYISKNEPIMQSAVIKAFGSSGYQHIKELVEKEFIKTARIGRTKRIETTSRFREYFNI